MGTEREGMIKKEGLQFSVISVILKIMQFINIENAGRNQNLRSEVFVGMRVRKLCMSEDPKRDLEWSD